MQLPIIVAMTGASGAGIGLRLVQTLLAAGRPVHLTASPSFAQVLRQELGWSVDLERFTPAEWIRDLGKLYGLSQANTTAAAVSLDTLCGTEWSEIAGDPVRELEQAAHDPARLRYSRYDDLFSPIASGSSLSGGMVVCPCSGTTLSAIAHAHGTNLIHRAAEVHLKERRKLILVPRETPLSLPQLENMRTATLAGAIVLPAMPGWYHEPRSLLDLIDFVVARICDQLGVEHELMRRWGE